MINRGKRIERPAILALYKAMILKDLSGSTETTTPRMDPNALRNQLELINPDDLFRIPGTIKANPELLKLL